MENRTEQPGEQTQQKDQTKKELRVPEFGKSNKGGKKKKKWVVLALVAVLVAAGVWVVRQKLPKPASAAAITYTETAVERRDISQTLSGSGALEPADAYTVTALVSGEVTGDTFEEGDQVSEGDTLYTLEASDASSSVTQAQINYQSAVDAKYPKATISGIVSEVLVHDGDSVGNGTEICTIIGNSNLSIDFLFAYASMEDFYVGQSATIYITGFAGSLFGTVTAVSSSYTVSSTGMKLCTVRVEVENPGLVTTDYTAQASIAGNSSYGNASIALSSTSTVKASGSGTVKNLKLLAGDTVTAGQVLCTVSSDSVDNSITNAQLNLNNSKDKLSNYTITSPISGTVVEKNVKAGDNLNNSSNSTSMAIIYDLSYMKMELSIDELDISTVAVGQEVSITADAVEGTFTGTVSKVAINGTTSNGVTTYPVTVVLEEYGALRPGMNVTAEIMITQAESVLSVPNAAVNRGNTVFVTADSPSASNAAEGITAPDGYVAVSVTTGVSDDDYIEITDGLQEGDTVAYVPSSADSSSNTDAMMGGMMMGGGAPGGGNMGGGQRPSSGMGGGPMG